MTLGILTVIIFVTLFTDGYWINKIVKSHNRMKIMCTALFMGVSAIVMMMISVVIMMGLGVCDMTYFFPRFSMLSALFLLPLLFNLFSIVSVGERVGPQMSIHFFVPLAYIVVAIMLGVFASGATEENQNMIVKFCLSYGFNIFFCLQIVYYIIRISYVFSRYRHVMSNYFVDKKYTDFAYVIGTIRVFTLVLCIVVSLLAIRLNSLVGNIVPCLIYCLLFYIVNVSLGYCLCHCKAKGLPHDPSMDITSLTLSEIQELEDKFDTLDSLRETQKATVNISEIIEKWVGDKSMPYLRSKLTINDVADEMHIPLKILSSYLNTTLGQNFNTWINSHRINHVKYLLLSSDMTLDEIASVCGFTDRSALSRIFRTMVGVTPSEYKSQNAGIKL